MKVSSLCKKHVVKSLGMSQLGMHYDHIPHAESACCRRGVDSCLI